MLENCFHVLGFQIASSCKLTSYATKTRSPPTCKSSYLGIKPSWWIHNFRGQKAIPLYFMVIRSPHKEPYSPKPYFLEFNKDVEHCSTGVPHSQLFLLRLQAITKSRSWRELVLVISSLRRRFGCMVIPTCITCLIYVYVVITFVCLTC